MEFSELMDFLSRKGVNPLEIFNEYPRKDINSCKSFGLSVWETLILGTKRLEQQVIMILYCFYFAQ